MALTKEQFETWAVGHGYTKDRHGHFQKLAENGKKYRYKIQAHSVRFEVQVLHEAGPYSPASKSWVRMRSAYFKDLSLTEDGKLKGLLT